MSALSVADIHSFNDEPCVLDLRLAEALGFERAHDIRKLIKRNIEELQQHGLISAMVALIKPSDDNPRGAGPIATAYHLNEAQALLICMFSRTPKAAEVRGLLIDVFMAWRQGVLVPPEPTATRRLLPGHPDFGQAVRLVREARLTRGPEAALSLWREIGLPWTPEMEPPAGEPVDEADAVTRFAAEGIERAPGVATPAAALWRAFEAFCDAHDLPSPPKASFLTRFGRMGFRKRKVAGRSVYFGIRPASLPDQGAG